MMYSRSGHLLSNGGYPREIWNSFTGQEKSHVYRMREQREADTRQAAAITRENDTNRQDNTEENPRATTGVGTTMTRRES